MSNIKIGSRVLYNFKFKGTVKFVGETSLAKGILYGLELDTPDGKMNGTMNGISYFVCKDNYGIFVRFSQLSEITDEKIDSKKEDNDINEELETQNLQNKQLSGMAVSNLLIEKPNVEISKKRNTIALKTSTNNEKENQCIQPVISNLPRLNPSFNVRRNTMAPSIIPESKKPPSSNNAIIEQKSLEIKDLKEQLETIKHLKRKDREEIQKSARLIEKLHHEIALLTEQINTLSQEKLDIIQEFASYKDSMRTVEEDIEMAAIDKEMAEEKLEQSLMDYEALKVLYDKSARENELLKLEGSSDAKHFIDQSETISKYEKIILEMSHSIKTLQTMVESRDSELEILREMHCFLESEVCQLRAANEKSESDLRGMQDLVDSTADMELIVEKLTFENEMLELQQGRLASQLQESEAEERASTARVESSRVEILKLLEEIECMSSVICGLEERERDHQAEQNAFENALSTAQSTIASLQKELGTLQAEAAANNKLVTKWREDSRRLSVIDYAQQTSVRTDILRDMQDRLNKIEIENKSYLIQLLYQFLPATFVSSSVDNKMISVVLLMQRLFQKITMVIDHVKMLGRKMRGSDYTRKCEKSSSCQKLEFLLERWRALVEELTTCLDRCGLQKLQQVVPQAQDLIHLETTADMLIELCKKECIDVGRNFDTVIKTIHIFTQFYLSNFENVLGDCNAQMTAFITVVYRGALCVLHDSIWIEQSISAEVDTNIQFPIVLDKLKSISSAIESKLKGTLRIMKSAQRIEFDHTLLKSMHETISTLLSIVETVSVLGLQVDEGKISSLDVFQNSSEMFHQYDSGNELNRDVVRALEAVEQVSCSVAENIEKGLYDSSKVPMQVEKSIDQCAIAHRARLMKLQNMPSEVQMKKEEIRALNQKLKIQMNLTSDCELQVQYLKKKMNGVSLMKDKEISVLMEELRLVKTAPMRSDNENIQEIDRLNKELERLRATLDTEPHSVADSNNGVQQNNEIREMAKACIHLSRMVTIARANKSQRLLTEMKPLPAVSRARRIETPGAQARTCFVNRVALLTEEIYRELSGTRVLDLSGKTRSFFDQASRRPRIRRQFMQLQSDYQKFGFGEPYHATIAHHAVESCQTKSSIFVNK